MSRCGIGYRAHSVSPVRRFARQAGPPNHTLAVCSAKCAIWSSFVTTYAPRPRRLLPVEVNRRRYTNHYPETKADPFRRRRSWQADRSL